MATVKTQGVLVPHTHTARPLSLTCKAFALLLLLGALLAGFSPVPAEAQTFTHTQITNSTGGFNDSPSINSDGTRIAFRSNSDLTGGNADGNTEIFLWTSGSGITQITSSTVGINIESSINSDGTRIAFYSDRDLTPGSPGNADGNLEIFLAGSASAAIPTLSEWAQIGMVALLLGGGLCAIRRKRQRLVIG